MKEYRLKKGIRKGTRIVDLYEDGVYYYLIEGKYYPIDFNDFKHSGMVEPVDNSQDINN